MKPKNKYIEIVDETHTISEKSGNGLLKYLVNADSTGKIIKYSLTYINFRLCKADNGRVLGYNNNYVYHHRHFMGKEEKVNFISFEEISERFENEWRELHEEAKKYHY
jgi:hypothetical protein